MTRDIALVKAALEAAKEAIWQTRSRAVYNTDEAKADFQKAIDNLDPAAIAAGVHEPLDHCGACGQWIGGPVECCHHSHEQPCVTASRAAEIRRAAEIKELVALRAIVAEVPETSCAWTEDESGEYWETECGKAFTITSGTPSDNGMRHCCYCGKLLREAA